MSVTITTIDEEQVKGIEIRLAELNKMTKTGNKPIIYKGNLLDEDLTVWMLFECDGQNYLLATE